MVDWTLLETLLYCVKLALVGGTVVILLALAMSFAAIFIEDFRKKD